MGILRTPSSEAVYKKLVAEGLLLEGCALCDAPSLKEFQHWRIIENKFPYDKIAETHHMIIPKNHVSDKEISSVEKEEFETIKKEYLHPTYEYMIEATYKKKSIPEHSHLHLIIAKE